MPYFGIEEQPMTAKEYQELIPEMTRFRLNNLKPEVQSEIGWTQGQSASDREVVAIWMDYKDYVSLKNLTRLMMETSKAIKPIILVKPSNATVVVAKPSIDPTKLIVRKKSKEINSKQYCSIM